jgi:uncharacterized protein YndB with AHSA1/START domain
VTSHPPRRGDEARATVFVALTSEDAFRIFTEDIDRWWRRGVRFRNAGARRGFIRIEPGPNGRVFESFDGDNGRETVAEIGRVTLWEPPERLLFEWRSANFSADEKTEVEVTFRPSGAGCEVCVSHRGWAMIRKDHPVRHGADAAGTLRSLGLWWGDLLIAFRQRASKPPEGD